MLLDLNSDWVAPVTLIKYEQVMPEDRVACQTGYVALQPVFVARFLNAVELINSFLFLFCSSFIRLFTSFSLFIYFSHLLLISFPPSVAVSFLPHYDHVFFF